MRPCLMLSLSPVLRAAAFSTATVASVISGPIPSPGKTASLSSLDPGISFSPLWFIATGKPQRAGEPALQRGGFLVAGVGDEHVAWGMGDPERHFLLGG